MLRPLGGAFWHDRYSLFHVKIQPDQKIITIMVKTKISKKGNQHRSHITIVKLFIIKVKSFQILN